MVYWPVIFFTLFILFMMQLLRECDSDYGWP